MAGAWAPRPMADASHYTALVAESTSRDISRDNTGDLLHNDSYVLSVVQFSCAQYFTKEGEEEEVAIDIVRLGDCSSDEVEFDFRSVDKSAKAGEKYEAMEGTIRFEKDESMKTIMVPIFQSDAWESTLEFNLEITAVRGAKLGKYLHSCRVKIIDNDYFPTNLFADEFVRCQNLIGGPEELDIEGKWLMVEYCRLVYRDRFLRRKTIQHMLLDQISNINFFLSLYLQMYLVDVVLAFHGPEGEVARVEDEAGEERRLLKQGILNAGRLLTGRRLGEEEEPEERPGFMIETLLVPGHRRSTAMVVALIYILPFLFVHIAELMKCRIFLQGRIRRLLQANLLQRFLHYREERRQSVNPVEITMLIVRDIDEVVDFGFMKILVVVRVIGKLTLALVFILAENRMAAIPLVIFPIILGSFLALREKMTIAVNEETVARRNDMVQCVSDCINKFRHIADFGLSSYYVDMYSSLVQDMNRCATVAMTVATNNSFVAPWLTTILIGLYIIDTTFQGIDSVKVGLVVATINIFKEVGLEMQEVYKELLEIQKSFGALMKVSYFMNLETDHELRMKTNRERRKKGSSLRQDLRTASTRRIADMKAQPASTPSIDMPPECMFAVDQIPIHIKVKGFAYSHGSKVLDNVDLQLTQGHMYAVVGPPHEGKATFMKLIGQVIVPSGDVASIFVPPHLRILHLSRHCSLMSGSFLQNVILNADLKQIGGMERVKRICQEIGFENEVLDYLDSDDRVQWCERLSDSAMQRLSLARALVMNPEVLVVHKPSAPFAPACVQNVLKMLQKHVRQRGICLPESEMKFRRPRTLFFTTTSKMTLDFADRIIEVSKSSCSMKAAAELSMSDFA